MQLSTAIDGFLLAKRVAGLSPNTIRNYTTALQRFRDWLGERDPHLEDVTKGDIRRFLDHLLTARFTPPRFNDETPQTLSPKTVRNIHTCLSSLWTWAVGEEYVEEHIVRDVEAPKPDPPVIEPLGQAQIAALLEATQYSRVWEGRPGTRTQLPKEQRLRDRALILFLLDSGVRASELCRARVADVDLTTGAVKVRGKSRRNAGQGKERLVYIGQRTQKAVWRYLAARGVLGQGEDGEGRLFVTNTGEPLTRQHLHNHLGRLGDRADVAHVYPHRFRHTFAITYLRNEGDIYTLQNQLGHTSLHMVRRYLKLAQADNATAHRRASPVDNWKL